MSRLEAVLTAAKRDRLGALIGYLPIGFPTLDESIEAAVALVENGVDVLELGIPYSDPVMDGVVIQRATQQSLANGFKLADAFTAVAAISARVDAPILLMTYWNPVVQYGVDRFAADLAAAGGAGLITPDLTPDEAADWLAASASHDLDRVFLAAPTSTDARLSAVIQASRGFVYTVSTMGTTGARADVDAAARVLVGRLRQLQVPFTCVGVGISTPDQVADVLGYADGAIVGSALVAALADGGVAGAGALAAKLAAGTASTGAID